jgi:5'-methylthioadenosine phosphorylase
MTNVEHVIGVIGGSGVYDIDALENKRWQRVTSPFGEPSDELLFGEIADVEMVFLPRHGRGHRIPPGEINFRANIDALKRSGVTDILSVSAVGSLRDDLTPGTFVIVDQFIDRTVFRDRSFFGTGLVAHVPMAHPVCSRVGKHVAAAGAQADVPTVEGGTYIVIEGPQFSTIAESELYRSWGADVIGMTNMPEARLAREAEMCYASVAMVTDFDCWHPDHESVTVDAIIRCLLANADRARKLVEAAAPLLHGDSKAVDCPCRKSLDHAIVTAPHARDESIMRRLDAVAGRVLNKP